MRYQGRSLGALIRRQRMLHGITQQELGTVLIPGSRCFQTISNVERGMQGLSAKHAPAISRKLQVPLSVITEAMVEDYRESLGKELERIVGAL